MKQVQRQFGPSAAAYLESATHAGGEDLDRLVELADLRKPERVLDLGCGVGHTLRRVAPRARLAVGADATIEMLGGARTLMARERITNALLAQTAAARLPFADASFDAVTCRLAAHHFDDVAAAFGEVARVLRPRGRFVLVDNYAPDDEELDRFINLLETTRDPSHARSHTLAGWRALLNGAGLRPGSELLTGTRIEVEGWLARSRTPELAATTARAMLRTAPAEAALAFAIGGGVFTVPKLVVRADRG